MAEPLTEITAESLLSGPRGRRLCFEIATELLRREAAGDGQDSRLSAVFYAAYASDPGAGTSRALFGHGGNRIPKGIGGIDRAAKALAEIDIVEFRESELLSALATTVQRAAYWQPPDGEDVLAAHELLREPLQRVAEYLAAAPMTQWWQDSHGPSDAAPQWVVEWEDTAVAHPYTSDPSHELREWGLRVRASEDRAQRERPKNPRANWSGEWWSTPPTQLPFSTRALGEFGPLGLHLFEDGFGWERAIVRPLGVEPGARIAVIRTPDDWAELCADFPLTVTAEKRHDWYRVTGRSGEWVMPDWERVSETYDGVHLTMLGYLSCAGRALAIDAHRSSVIAGWHPDATWWLGDRVRVWDEPVAWEVISADAPSDLNSWRRVD